MGGMTDEERADEARKLEGLLTRCGGDLWAQRGALFSAHHWLSSDDLVIVVPDSFSADVVDGSLFQGCRLARGMLDEPVVKMQEPNQSPPTIADYPGGKP